MKREPDFEQFLKVLWRRGRPDHLPFYEHIASPGFIARRLGVPFDRMSSNAPEYWRLYVDFWLGMGFDCVPIEIPPRCPLPETEHGRGGHQSEAQVVIRTWEDFERYPWPDESSPMDLGPFEIVAGLLPDGAKMVAGVEAGPYEWVSRMMGGMGLAYALFDHRDLVVAVFEKMGRLHVAAHRQLAAMDAVGALRQGDDLGFKTSTFLAPADLRQMVFPIYKRLAAAAHERDKPFILHSCGNLAAVYDDLIDDCRIDAKHSFEDGILPVAEFKKRYGARITPLGGLDVDTICRSDAATLRRYARENIEKCFYDGHWALGTGNSLTDYMPVENYLVVLEEGLKAAGG